MPTPIKFPEKIIKVVETHISRIYIGEKFVYKQKKPVDFGFIDYTRKTSRKFFALKELSLNRRACKGVYKDVLELRRGKGKNGKETLWVSNEKKGGKVVDYLVRMKRLAPESFLDRILEAGDSRGEKSRLLSAVAKRIYLFHKSANTSKRITGFGSVKVYGENWNDNFLALEGLFPESAGERVLGTLKYIEEFYPAVLKSDGFNMFARERAAAGLVRDCHGDLRMEQIAVTGKAEYGNVCLTDRIEFNDMFRFQDIFLDVAFLLMDFEKNGFFYESLQFFSFYEGFFNHVKYIKPFKAFEPLIMPFFKAYRSVVRTKISLLSGSASGAVNYLNLALFYVNIIKNPPVIVNVGLSGSGKSSLSELMASYLYAAHLRTDEIRHKILGGTPTDVKYGREANESVYSAMLEEGGNRFLKGEPVIFDGTFLRKDLLKSFIGSFLEKTGAAGINLIVVYSKIPPGKEEVIIERLRKRQEGSRLKKGKDIDFSEAGEAVYLKQKREFEEPDSELYPVITVDASLELDKRFNSVMEQILKNR